MQFLNVPQSSGAFTMFEIAVLATGPQLKTSTRLGDSKLSRLCFSILVALSDSSSFKIAACSIYVGHIESCIAVNASFGLLIDATIRLCS